MSLQALFSLLLLLICGPTIAQIDSLINLYEQQKNSPDTGTVLILQKIAIAYRQTDLIKSAEYSDKTKALADELGWVKGQLLALNDQAISYAMKGDNYEALSHFKACLKLDTTQVKDKNMGDIYNNLGIAYMSLSDYDKSLAHYQLGLHYRQKAGKDMLVAASHNNIGLLFYRQDKFDKGLEYFLAGLEIYDSGDTMALPQLQVNLLNNVGLSYVANKEFMRGIPYFKRSIAITDREGMLQSKVSTLGYLGEATAGLEQYDEALALYQESITLADSIGDEYGKVSVLFAMGSNLVDMKRYADGIAVLERVEEKFKAAGDLSQLQKTVAQLARAWSDSGDHQAAYEYAMLNIRYKDSIFDQDSERLQAEMETTYQLEKKDLELAKKDLEILEQNTRNIALSVGLGLALLLGVIILRSYRIKRRDNQIISQQKQEVELQKDQLEEKNTEIMDSINYAKRLQDAILPPLKVVKSYLAESFILFKPKDVVAGDFYWMEPTKSAEGSDVIFFAAADCTGHGVPGALVSVVCHNALNRAVREFGRSEPAKILDQVRELVERTFAQSEEQVRDGMDIALCALNLQTLELQYAGANNGLYIIKPSESEHIEVVKADKQPIGVYAEKKPFTNHKIQMTKGESIYLFSDGYADQFGGDKGKKFKYKPFKDLLLSVQGKSMAEQHQIIDSTFENWRGDLEQVDDVCIIGVKI